MNWGYLPPPPHSPSSSLSSSPSSSPPPQEDKETDSITENIKACSLSDPGAVENDGLLGVNDCDPMDEGLVQRCWHKFEHRFRRC